MHKVYRGVNTTLKEVYHGTTTKDLEDRTDEHCSGLTKALEEWECGEHDIHWEEVGSYKTKSKASKAAHEQERTYDHGKGFKNINTRGI